MDLQDVSYGFNSIKVACQRIPTDKQFMLLPITEDALIPAAELDEFASLLGSCGVAVHHERLSSIYGHVRLNGSYWHSCYRLCDVLLMCSLCLINVFSNLFLGCFFKRNVLIKSSISRIFINK